MSLKDIREYIELAMQGDATIAQRLEMFRKQKAVLEARMAELQQTMDTLDYKCWFYETAKARGTRGHQRPAGRRTARGTAPGARAPAGSGGMKAESKRPGRGKHTFGRAEGQGLHRQLRQPHHGLL